MSQGRHLIFSSAALLALAIAAAAFTSRASAVTVDWVRVADAGNAPDPATGSLYGAVAYEYYIAKHGVTVGQYSEFLNAVAATDTYDLYHPAMATDLNIAGIARSGAPGSYSYSVIGSAQKPITYVSWGDAARFANWLQNGQPTGAQSATTTERGAYRLDGATSAVDLSVVTRVADATIFLPSENEWYKAAYYDGSSGDYYQYGHATSATPISSPPGSTPNSGNFADLTTGYAVTGSTVLDPGQNYLTDVGAYTASASPSGAFDMGGNVGQWNESSVRGGSWRGTLVSSATRAPAQRSFELYQTGFRVASVPEPRSMVLAVLGGVALCVAGKGFRRRGGR